MAAKPLIVGDVLDLVRGLKELGVIRGKVDGLEFEFGTPFVVSSPVHEDATEHLTPEEYEAKAKQIRKALDAEVYAAS